REERLAVADGGEPPDELDAGSAQGIQVERRSLGRADELRRRQIARTLDIVYFIVTLVPEAAALEPPQDVPAAVHARHAHVLADGKDDAPPGSADLVGDLHARGRRADDEHAALRQSARVAVIERREALDRRRQRFA